MAPEGGDDWPTVGASLSGWTRTEASSDTVFELSRASVTGHTVVYEDSDLRERVRDRTGVDRMWRFFFATRLAFSPPLPPGVGPAAVFNKVASEAEGEFRSILDERGFGKIAQGRQERIRVGTGDRARLRRYTATLDIDGPDGDPQSLPVAGHLAVWTVDGEFRLAGGAYPTRSLASLFDDPELATEPDAFQTDLIELIRSVR